MSCRVCVCRFSHIAVHFTVHLTGSGGAALHNTNSYDISLHSCQYRWIWYVRRGCFSSIITVFPNNLTLWADCLLSDTLLARILNLSTQASKSSLTPTTNNRNTRWKQPETDHRIASKGILSCCLSERKAEINMLFQRNTPAGFMVLPEITTSTAVVTKIPTVPFSEINRSSIAKHKYQRH